MSTSNILQEIKTEAQLYSQYLPVEKAIWIVMPVYNEAENITAVLREWHAVTECLGENSVLLAVDDGSTDNSLRIMQGLCKELPHLRIESKKNEGYGVTIISIYKYAVHNGADWVFQTDSDGQTNPVEFFQILPYIETHEYIWGIRQRRQDGVGRIVIARIMRLLLWLVFGLYMPDANVPFRMIRADILQREIQRIPPKVFLSNVLLSVSIQWFAYRGKYIPISFRKRVKGNSQINWRVIIKLGITEMHVFRAFRAVLEESTDST